MHGVWFILIVHCYLIIQFSRNAAKLKKLKEEQEKASKQGINVDDLKIKIEELEKENKTLTDQDEELKKKEKVCFYLDI